MIDGLNALGDHPALERGSQAEHALKDGEIVEIAEAAADKAGVDLDLGRRKIAQVLLIRKKSSILSLR